MVFKIQAHCCKGWLGRRGVNLTADLYPYESDGQRQILQKMFKEIEKHSAEAKSRTRSKVKQPGQIA
jgi:hypothetical protein